MNELKSCNDAGVSPVVREIVMSNRIGAIAVLLARSLGITAVGALKLFYRSKTCAQMHDYHTGLYLYSNHYIADEMMRELADCQE